MFAFQGINRDAFGGPQGSNSGAIQMLMQGIMQGMQKKQDAAQLSSLFSSPLATDQGQMPSNVAVNSPGVGPNGVAPVAQQQPDPGKFVDWVLANPNMSRSVKGQAIEAVKMKSDLAGAESSRNYQDAMADKARRPEPAAAEKSHLVEYWDTEGKKHLHRVPESQFNKFTQWADKQGFAFEKVEANDTPTTEFERHLNSLEKAGNITPKKKNELIHKRIQKMIETGAENEPSNTITMGDGMKVTLGELRAQYREKYNIPDEFDLQMMELSPDPRVRDQAAKLKAEAATKPSFVEFMADARKNGLEGLRPESIKNDGPADLPEGFNLD